MLEFVIRRYGLKRDELHMFPLGNGLINSTWKLSVDGKDYVLQKVNDEVFKKPENIDWNLNLIAAHLQQYYPEYNLLQPIFALDGSTLVQKSEHEYFRMFPFIPDSHSKDVVETPEQAFQAAARFGKFTNMLAGISVDELKITIPDFHNLSLRYQQFLAALATGDKNRIKEADELIQFIKLNNHIVRDFEKLTSGTGFKIRATHHDTKISNVLFDSYNNGICVIDLDTVMPGYFISDLGDMMRTYLSPVSEEESDFSMIEVRDEFYEAIVSGYFNEMKNELTEEVKKYFFYSGTFMIYMQAIRFLTDYLNNDVYYGRR
ncbi:MAG: aminoglycoside phosphotransferase family protein, partial [Lacibacter sp.]|nr:aminoglycoside phosphotransferase family protein [Lacibacter sp.]